MAWNQPGSGQKPEGDKPDPWGRRPAAGGPKGPSLADRLGDMFNGSDPSGEKQLSRLVAAKKWSTMLLAFTSTGSGRLCNVETKRYDIRRI